MKKIYISRMTIICLFLCLFSICGLVACFIGMNAYYHARPLTDLSEDSLKSGKYASGTIMSYAVDHRWTKDKDDLFGIWQIGLDLFGREQYYKYIIPFNEEQYICIWVKDQKSLALLRESQDGLRVNVPFVGQIKYDEVSQSDHADDVLGFDHNKIISNYVIFQKTLSTEKFWIKACLLGILISIFLYRSKGRVEMSEVVCEDKEPQHVLCYSNISDEIAIVERRIRKNEKLIKEFRTGSCIGAVCVVIGVFLFVKFGNFTSLVSMILLTSYGIRKLWTYFINSKNGLSIFLANLFGLRTLQVKRVEDQQLLAELKKREEARPRPSPRVIPYK